MKDKYLPNFYEKKKSSLPLDVEEGVCWKD